VLTGEISHLATITAILNAGYTPVFTDVERCTGNISVESARASMAGDIRAIACTHIGGYPCDLGGLRELAGAQGIPLVEDCSHAIGAEYRGNRIGDGTLCCFSFGFPKAITGVEGGAVLTGEREYAEKIRALRNLGMREDVKFTEASMVPVIEEPGYRYIWNDVMASIALKQMDHLEADNRRRATIAKRYMDALEDMPGVYLPSYGEDRVSSFFFIPLFFKRRDDLARRLETLGIRTKIYFRGYSEYYGDGTRFPNATWYGGHELTLPINVHMSVEDQDRIIVALGEGW
jgi:dTDP-4-amino-4,6-dideoxygalactose transaminase